MVTLLNIKYMVKGIVKCTLNYENCLFSTNNELQFQLLCLLTVTWYNFENNFSCSSAYVMVTHGLLKH